MDDQGETVTIRREQWEGVLARLEALERAAAPPDASAPVATSPEPTPPDVGTGGPVSRRRAIAGLAGATAAGLAGAVATGRPAAAADGGALQIGNNTNTGTMATGLAVTGTTAAYGIGVTDNGLNTLQHRPALFGHAKQSNFAIGVAAFAESGATGVYGQSVNGTGVFGASSGGSAGIFETSSPSVPAVQVFDGGGRGAVQVLANKIHLLLVGGDSTAPPSRSTQATRGAVAATTDGSLWYCIATGTPGTWRKLSGPGTAGALHVLPAPKRVYDSRPGTQPAVGSKTKLVKNQARVLDLKVNGSGVPAGATAALLTIFLINAANANGNFTVWANGVARPQANTMVWGPSGGRFTCTALSALSSGAGIQVVASHPTDLVVDVLGYFR